MTSDNVKKEFQTDSKRYGNDKTIQQVFDREDHPAVPELKEALAETSHLTEKEAFAFAHGNFGQLPLPKEIDEICKLTKSHGIESTEEFLAVKQRAMKKISEAIWIFELIDAYRLPDFPEQCAECNQPLGGMWVNQEEGLSPVCRDCADIDGDLH